MVKCNYFVMFKNFHQATVFVRCGSKQKTTPHTKIQIIMYAQNKTYNFGQKPLRGKERCQHVGVVTPLKGMSIKTRVVSSLGRWLQLSNVRKKKQKQ